MDMKDNQENHYMRSISIFIIITLFILCNLSIAQDSLVGHWDFNDPEDLTKAVIGRDLIF